MVTVTGYGDDICHLISDMYPFRDQDLVDAMQSIYPSQKELQLLGPILSKKVLLMEPFFRWVPPKEKKTVCFDDLPTPLEELTDEIVEENDMEQWLDPHDGVVY